MKLQVFQLTGGLRRLFSCVCVSRETHLLLVAGFSGDSRTLKENKNRIKKQQETNQKQRLPFYVFTL